MKDKCFLDSNLLVYLYDDNENIKQNFINDFLTKLRKSGNPVISTQTIGEFFNITTRKFKLPKETINTVCQNFTKIYPVYEISVENVFHALKISQETQYSYWDSLIIAVAIDTGCSTVYSEDLTDGQTVEGVKIVNPFMAYV